MPPIRLIRSRVFQLSLLTSAIFGIAAFAVVATLYYSSLQAVTRQIEATIDAEIKGLAEQYRQFGSIGLIRTVERRTRRRSRPGALYLVVDSSFTPLAGNVAAWPKEEPDARGWVAFPFLGDGDRSRNAAAQGEARGRMFRLRGGFYLLVGHDLREQQRVTARTRETLILAGIVAVLFAIASGGLLSWLVLRRIDSINRTSREIMAGDLARRVPETGRGDEFDRLAQSLNAMLAQNEKLFLGMREVAENLAHDLRSPLGRVRQRLERQLSDALSASEKQALSVEALEETDRLLATFNAILSIAQADSGAPKRSFEPVDLRTLLQDVADLYEPLVEDAGAKLALALPGRSATVRGNRDMLFQACANLIDNAIKYGLGADDPAPAATIDLKLDLDGETARLSVRDRGAGLHGAALERARERFYRADASRTTGGSGLGLSLVDAVARLHGGALILAPAAPGLRATVSLPLDKRGTPKETGEDAGTETPPGFAGAAATKAGGRPG
ncbi:MAG: ATP-binding protein [Rhodospirillaceae bacterium]|nr:ATP-binding protein [Rhodospirillaceae bacterium]